MESFEKELKRKQKLIEEYMLSDLDEENLSYSTVISAMKYSVSAGGKRIRPVLMMSICELFGKSCEEILPFAAGIEYIHTYSLIHDDLPSMDNDDLRRGLPTCHKKFSEAMAILAGDALLNYAYEKMLSSDISGGIKAVRYILNAAGKDGMIGGQVIDIENENNKISLELLNELHALKTGALIRAACVAGAVLGGASEEEVGLLGEFGSLIGMAFQVKDDILDKVSSTEELGKPVGSDEKNNKTTYLSYFGIDECENIVKELTERANEILDKFENNEFLKELTNYLIVRNK